MTDVLQTLTTVAELKLCVKGWRQAGLSVGLVPTMGALHKGHMGLVAAALEKCDRVVVTIFVNPTQFGPDDDFAAYPRAEQSDKAQIEAQIKTHNTDGTQVLFVPSVDEIYGAEEMTTVQVGHFDTVLEGIYRPGHYTGVATVVAKLLNLVQADHAFFGEKDYQQLQVIKQLAHDLCIPTDIHGVETVRDADGLALSSRNAYLSATEREQAPKLHQALVAMVAGYVAGESLENLEQAAHATLTRAGFGTVDYITIVDAQTLRPLSSDAPAHRLRALAAAMLGQARLIDNIAVTKA